MRTAKEQSPAKDKLIHSAVKLMRAKGYEATSVDDICCESKLTKGSFFHYFKDKESLAKAALDTFCVSQGEEMGKNPAKADRDPLKRFDGLIARMIEMSRMPGAINGCLIGNFAQELSDTHPGLREACAAKFDGFAGMLKTLLDEAKARYAPKKPLDTQGLALHFISLMQGSFVVGKAKQDTGVFRKNMGHFKDYLHGLFGE